jgi:hypothetical protein
MVMRSREYLVGAWAFFIGALLAVVGGVILSFGYSVNPLIFALLAILGLVVGFFVKVTDNGGTSFLLAAVSLVIVSYAGQQGISSVTFGTVQIGKIMLSTLGGLLVMLVPATIVVAIKSLFSIAQR